MTGSASTDQGRLAAPVRVAVVDDYDIVVEGTAALLAPHADRIRVVERGMDGTPDEDADVVLLDCFALIEGARMLGQVVAHPRVEKVAVYTWSNAERLIDAALALGASAYLGKGLSGAGLAEALVATHQGHRVVATHPVGRGASQPDQRDECARRWPGSEMGLTERESEVLALITQGLRTVEIAEVLYLSENSVKTHTRKLFRKIDVTTRTQAALWGIDHGFRPDRSPEGWD